MPSLLLVHLDAFALAALIYLPGLLLGWFAQIRRRYLFVLAPLISLALLSALPVLFRLISMRWSAGSFLGVVALGALALFLLRRPKRSTLRVKVPPLLLVGGALAWLGQVLPIYLSRSLTKPIQQIDSTYHMNLAWLIAKTGNGSSLSAPTRMFGLDTSRTTAPSGWHDLVALLGTRVVESTNALSLVVPLVWVLGITLLAYRIFAPNLRLVFYTQLVTLLFSEFPTLVQSTYPILPNTLAIALLPYALCALYQLWCDESGKSLAQCLLRGLFAAALGLALALVHPSFIFNLVALLTLPVGYLLFRGVRRASARGRKRYAVRLAVATLVLIVAIVALFCVPYTADLFYRMTHAYAGRQNIDIVTLLKIVSVASVHPTSVSAVATYSQLILEGCALVAFIGAVAASRTMRLPLLWCSWCSIAVVALAVMWRVGSALGGFWYMNAHRILAPLQIPAALLMAVGICWWCEQLRRILSGIRVRNNYQLSASLTCAFAVLIGFSCGVAAKEAHYTLVYSPSSAFITVNASAAEQAMITRAADRIKGRVRVIGNPTNGSALMQALGGVEVVFPQMYFRSSNVAEGYLRTNFHRLGSDGKVCRLLRRYQIEYFYYDTDPGPGGKGMGPKTDFVRLPAPSTVQKVDQGGSAKLYRIVACGFGGQN